REIETMGVRAFNTISDRVEHLKEVLRTAKTPEAQATAHMQLADAQRLQAYALAGSAAAVGAGGLVNAYDVGRSAGSSSGAAFGGAATGAQAGAAIETMFAPGLGTAIGAVVGGIDGLVLGLFGQASKIKQMQREFAVDQQKYIDSLASYPSQYARQFAGIERAFKDLEDAARAAHTSVSADAAAAKAQAEAKVRNDFLTDLGQQLNAVSGPAGAFANQVDAINKKYEENVQTARSLGLGEGALSEAQNIRLRSLEALIDAEANAASITDQLMQRFASLTGASLYSDPFATLR